MYDGRGWIEWDISVDSTIIRAHQHAAGAPPSLPPAQKGDGWRTKRGDPMPADLAARLEEVVRLEKD
ncbi:transposase [Herbidospora sp. NEAU-GS84]|uniref:Transposase n=1 Tax=Herbidospora solisilvae TaxID=2696284 RepID=A0A7C9NAL8_9ACTN|nr:transposase [Herbidospora solisilvae]